MKNKTIFKYIFIIIIFSAILYKGLFSDNEKYKIGALVGSKVPDFMVRTLDGNEFNANDIYNIQKDYKLLNFFASWCSTCMMEHDDLLELSSRNDIDVIGVIWRDNPRSSKAWLEKHGDPYDTLLIDKKGMSKFKFGLIGVPESFLIDADNNIIAHYRGPIDLEQLISFLENKINLVQ